MLAINLAPAFEATQHQPNMSDVTSQTSQIALVPTTQNALVPIAQVEHLLLHMTLV